MRAINIDPAVLGSLLDEVGGVSLPPLPAVAEQLIFLHGEDDFGWWIEHCDAEQPLFDAGNRIVECALSEAKDQVQQAMKEGFRPVLLVADIAELPAAMAALGRYEAFGEVWIAGRDDDEIRALLHRPSQQVEAAYRAQQPIDVPNAAYGEALDAILPTRLEDFVLESESLVPKGKNCEISLRSKNNKHRKIEIRIYPIENRYIFIQKLLKEKGSVPYQMPIRVHGIDIEFDDRGRFSATQGYDHINVLHHAVNQTFELPLAYAGPDDFLRAPELYEDLRRKLQKIGEGVSQTLSRWQAALMNVMPQADFQLQALASRAERFSREAVELPVILRSAYFEQHDPPDEIVFTLEWRDQDKPLQEPAIELAAAASPMEWSWNADFTELKLGPLTSPVTGYGWVWRGGGPNGKGVLQIDLMIEGTD